MERIILVFVQVGFSQWVVSIESASKTLEVQPKSREEQTAFWKKYKILAIKGDEYLLFPRDQVSPEKKKKANSHR